MTTIKTTSEESRDLYLLASELQSALGEPHLTIAELKAVSALAIELRRKVGELERTLDARAWAAQTDPRFEVRS